MPVTQKNYAAVTSFGERLAAVRRDRGYTQGDVAEALGVTKATISRYESNLIDVPRPKIQELARFLGVAPAYLMGWTEEKVDNSYIARALTDTQKEAPTVGPVIITSDNDTEKQLITIFRSLSPRDQTKLMAKAYALAVSDPTEVEVTVPIYPVRADQHHIAPSRVKMRARIAGKVKSKGITER